jgi:nitronate monooxygenase
MGRRVLRTELCDMLGIEYPIISAGMGPSLLGEEAGASVDLVVAVSEAGGCGVLGAAIHTMDQLREDIRKIKSRTDKPFGVDILMPKNVYGGAPPENAPDQIPLSEMIKDIPKEHQEWIKKTKEEMGLPEADLMQDTRTCITMPEEAVKIILEERVPLFCAGLGNPGMIVEAAHAVGTKVLAITGNAKNAGRLAQSGIDILVAQGHEAGGHTGRIGTMALIPQAIDAASPVPVLAAGGIGDGRGLAAALAMGCIGVWVGTRFLATKESGASDLNRERMVKATDEGTRISRVFTGKTLRGIYSSFHDLWDESGLDPLPFPMQMLVASALLDSFRKANRFEYVAGFAGQVSGLISEIKTAREVLEDMVEEAADILTRKLPENVVVE